MSSRKQEKDRLRQERLEAERRASAEARKRLILGYVVAGILGVAVVGGVIFAIASGGGGGGGGGEGEDGSANVNTRFGFLPEDLAVDERDGTTPPAVENGDLEGAANVAGCDLQLNLEDEGSTHFEDEDKVVKYKTNPADFRRPLLRPQRGRQRRPRRRRLPRDPELEPARPLARARPDRGPVQPRPVRGGSARDQGRLRRRPPGRDALPQ